MQITDTAGHYIHQFKTHGSAGPQEIGRLLDSLARKTHLIGDLASLEHAVERFVSDNDYRDEISVARAVKNIRRLRRANTARLSQQTPRTYRRPDPRRRDLCGND